MSQRCCYQPRCYSNCCDQGSEDKGCNLNRNRSCCDCFPTRFTPDFSSEQAKKAKPKASTNSNSSSMKPAPKSNMKSRIAQSKGTKAKSDLESDMPVSKKIDKYAREHMVAMKGKFCPNVTKQSETKHIKNKQNFQYQDMLGKKRMEVINEEQEDIVGCECRCEDDDDDLGDYFDSEQSKKLQESCADFLGIVHDTVLDTVQKSVESMLRDYFVHTMEKIECLSSQIMRNECLLSKMYYDVIDKVAVQGEKSVRQFKCLSQSLAEYRQGLNSNDKNKNVVGEKSSCPCPCACCSLKQEEDVLASAKSRIKVNYNCSCKSGRDSDTETTKTLCSNTDTSLRSYAASKSTSKAKDRDTSSTSITEEVGRSTRLSQDYADYLIKEQRRQQADAVGFCRSDCCRVLECCRPMEVQRTSSGYNDNLMDTRLPSCSCDNRLPSPTKYISVKSGPSGTDLLS